MLRIPLVISLLALSSACGPIPFDASVKGQSTIQGSQFGGLLSLFPQVGSFSNIDFNQNQDFENNNAQRDHVKTMRLKSFTIRVVSPDSQDFSFLDTLSFSIKAGDQQTKIAGKTGIADLGIKAPNATLQLDLEDVDVAEYVRASEVTITSSGTGRQPNQDTTLEADIAFTVGVGL